MNRIYKQIILGLTFLLLMGEGFAVDVPKYAVLDQDKILYESDVARYIQDQVEKQRGAFQKEVEGYEADLRAQEQALKEKQASSKGDDKDALEMQRNFEENVKEVQKKVSGRGKLLEERFNDARSKIIQGMMDVVGDVVRDEKISLVISKNAVLYRAEDLDITDKVLERLNNRMKTVDLKLPVVKQEETRAR